MSFSCAYTAFSFFQAVPDQKRFIFCMFPHLCRRERDPNQTQWGHGVKLRPLQQANTGPLGLSAGSEDLSRAQHMETCHLLTLVNIPTAFWYDLCCTATRLTEVWKKRDCC